MNKLPWFTHDNDAHTDKTLRSIFRKNGGILKGFGLWWTLIEILDRDGTGDHVDVDWLELEQVTGSKRGYLGVCIEALTIAEKVMIIDLDKDHIVYEIKNFRKRQSKMKSKVRSTLPEGSLNIPQEGEGERDKENNIGTSRSSVPKKKRKTATAPARGPFKEFADRYFSARFKAPIGVDTNEARAEVTALYARYGKAIKDILALSGGDVAVAVSGTHALEQYFKREKLSFTLDTIAKRFAEWKSDSSQFFVPVKKKDAYDLLVERQELEKLNGK